MNEIFCCQEVCDSLCPYKEFENRYDTIQLNEKEYALAMAKDKRTNAFGFCKIAYCLGKAPNESEYEKIANEKREYFFVMEDCPMKVEHLITSLND